MITRLPREKKDFGGGFILVGNVGERPWGL